MVCRVCSVDRGRVYGDGRAGLKSRSTGYVRERPHTPISGGTPPTRSARTDWNGGLQDGSGQVELTSSGVGTYDVSFPKRAAEDGGGTQQALEAKADVMLGEDQEAGGFKLTGIKLTVRGEVDGLDEAGFKEAAEKAKAGCPISKALAAVDITLDAALEG